MATFLTEPEDDRGTVIDLLERNAETIPHVPAATDGDTVLTWGAYVELAKDVAAGLHDVGLRPGDALGLQQSNRLEHLVTDVACLFLGVTTTSFYSTLAPEQLKYVANDSSTKVAVVGADHVATWEKIIPELDSFERLVVVDGDGDNDGLDWTALRDIGREHRAAEGDTFLEAGRAATAPDSIATLVYTSGTTGPPKGVIITHGRIRFIVRSIADYIEEGLRHQSGYADWDHAGRRLPPAGSPVVSYLPLAHIAERFASHYLAIAMGFHVHHVRVLEDLATTLPNAHPGMLMAVPRVWEKFLGAIRGKLREEGGPKAKLAEHALEVARQVGEREAAGTAVPLLVRIQHEIFDRLIYKRLREAMGLDRCWFPFTGAAPIHPDVLFTFRGAGIPIVEGYGMTETTGLMTITPMNASRPGSVGLPFHPEVELRLADDGEILFRGPNVTPGYLNMPEATAEAIDADGWLHTGDLGRFDDDGYLYIIGRKKELIITAAGKNLSPNNIEETIKSASALIAQCVAIGDRRKYVSALIVLDPEAADAWAADHGMPAATIADLAINSALRTEIDAAVAAANTQLARVEQVKTFTIIGDAWTPESPELTPTMKLRRNVIADRHAAAIDAMYPAD